MRGNWYHSTGHSQFISTWINFKQYTLFNACSRWSTVRAYFEERRPDSQYQSSRYIIEIIVTLLDSPEMPGTTPRQRFVCVFRLDHRPEECFPGQSSQEQTASLHNTWFTDKALQALKELLSLSRTPIPSF